MAAPWVFDQELRDLHGQGLSLNACAKQLHHSPSTISVHAKRLGLLWDRSKTAVAVAAKVADNKSRRAELESKLLAKADDLLAQMERPHLAWSFGGRDNEYSEHMLDKPSTVDIKNLTYALGAMIDRSLKIAVHDGTGGDNTAAVDRWLTHMTGDGN